MIRVFQARITYYYFAWLRVCVRSAGCRRALHLILVSGSWFSAPLLPSHSASLAVHVEDGHGVRAGTHGAEHTRRWRR